MGLKEMMQNFLSRKEKFKEIRDEEQFRNRLNQRTMSADERELARYLKENRDAKIKTEVEKFRKQKNNEMWHGKTPLDAKNIFVGQKKIFSDKVDIRGRMDKEKELFFS